MSAAAMVPRFCTDTFGGRYFTPISEPPWRPDLPWCLARYSIVRYGRGKLDVHHGSLIQQCSLRDRNWSRCSCGTAYNDECMGLTFQSPTTSENSLALSPSLHSDQRLHTTSLYPLFTSFENTIFRDDTIGFQLLQIYICTSYLATKLTF